MRFRAGTVAVPFALWFQARFAKRPMQVIPGGGVQVWGDPPGRRKDVLAKGAIVCGNGGVVCWPHSGFTIQL